MTTIFLPTMAALRKDIETTLRLLERTVKNQDNIGLEVIGKLEHFQSEETLKKIVENITSVAEGAKVVVHGFSGIFVYENGAADMRAHSGEVLLSTYLRLGRVLGAKYVHVHGGAGYRGEKWTIEERRSDFLYTRRTLLSCGTPFPEITVGIENLPSPSMGDVEKNPEKVWRDCVELVDDCWQVIQGTELNMTLDTCHYAINCEGPVDLVEPIARLGSQVTYLHVSDTSGSWVPNESLFKEGLIPGDGRIGTESFENLFRYLKGFRPDIDVCVEVYNKDYTKLEESEEAIKRILSWLQ